jgi:hypothetical protein
MTEPSGKECILACEAYLASIIPQKIHFYGGEEDFLGQQEFS